MPFKVEYYHPLTDKWHSASEKAFQGKAAADRLSETLRTRDSNTPGMQFRVKPVAGTPMADLGKSDGGKVSKVAGPKVGKDDGVAPLKRGEYVVKKASAEKYGSSKMAAVNRGTAKVTSAPTRKKGR